MRCVMRFFDSFLGTLIALGSFHVWMKKKLIFCLGIFLRTFKILKKIKITKLEIFEETFLIFIFHNHKISRILNLF